MTDRTGRCLCGTVSFKINAEPLATPCHVIGMAAVSGGAHGQSGPGASGPLSGRVPDDFKYAVS